MKNKLGKLALWVFAISIHIRPGRLKEKEWRPIVGALYHPRDKVLFKSFQLGVEWFNKQELLPHRQKIEIVFYETDGRDLLGCAVGKELRDASCIFDLSFNDDRSYALGQLLRIPVLILKPILDGGRSHDYVFSLRPTEDTTAKAIADITQYYHEYEHQKIAIIAERKRSHLAARVFSLVRQRERLVPYMMPELVMDDNVETLKSLTVLLRSRITYVVLLCDPKDTRVLLEKAMKLGCVNQKSRWITNDMEIPGNISALALRGLVGLRLHSTRNRLKRDAEKKTTGPRRDISSVTYALLNDSVYAVGMAMKAIISKPLSVQPGNTNICSFRSAISTGREHTLLNCLATVKFQGITGPVAFKPASKERDVEIFDILNVQIQSKTQQSSMYKIGNWRSTTVSSRVTLRKNNLEFWNGEYWVDMQCDFRSGRSFSDTSSMHHKELIVTTIKDAPFLRLKKNSSGLRGNNMYEGFSVDLLNLLSKKLKFKYKIKISSETSYGAPKEGEWKGLVGELVRQEADIAIGPITITAEREEVIDFSKPFLDFRIAMIMQKPKGEVVNLFAFLLPFEEQLWLCVCAIVGLVTLIMWILDRFSPYGYRAEALSTGEGDGTEFSLSNSLWFATGSILQQGGDNTPRSGSGRVLAASFWLFTLILISTYTANLAAYFTAKNTKSSINSLEDLVKQDNVRYGVLKGGSLYTFFKNSKVSTYKKMFGKMKTLETFVSNTSFGVDKARAGSFAYLTDQPSLDYYNQRKPCSTMLVKNLLDAKSYAFGMQRNSEWTNDISVAILALREEGEVEKLRLRWWDERSECPPSDQPDSAPTRLALHHLAGVFIILGGGAAISLALLLVENRCRDVFSSGRPQSPAEGARDDTDGLSQLPPTITVNGGTPLKLINNADRRQEPDGKNRRSPRPDSTVNRRPGYDLRIPEVYASAPESNL